MTKEQIRRLEQALWDFCEQLTSGLGRRERREAMGLYISGLLLDGERKSIQPMAGRLAAEAAQAEPMRQRLQQAVAVASWAEQKLYGKLTQMAERQLPGLEAFVVDDTGFAKKGDKSVGVARQYSGTLGRVDTCQVATTLHLAGEPYSVCIGHRLFVPDEWMQDAKRCQSVGIPSWVVGKRKWEIALDLLDHALAAGAAKRVVLADAGYGEATEFRQGLVTRQLTYLVGVSGVPTIWVPGEVPSIASRKNGARGPAPQRVVAPHKPVTLADFAVTLGKRDFRTVTWRMGSKGKMQGQFYAARVYSAERRTKKNRPPLQEVWLIIERTNEQKRPYKFYFSNLPVDTRLTQLVRLAKLRWRVERDYQEMKGELGLDHFEGRTWSGFHHHAALCAAAHALLTFQRRLSPPVPLDSASSTPTHPNRCAPLHWSVPSLSKTHRASVRT